MQTKAAIKTTVFSKQLTSGALQLAVIISFIVVLLCSFFIFRLYTASRFIDNAYISTRQFNAIESAVQLYLVKDTDFTNESIVVANDTVTCTIKQWGFFTQLLTQCGQAENQIKKAYCVGYLRDSITALYIANNNEALIISGKTTISGKTFAPHNGIRYEFIGNEGFSGSISTIDSSEQNLPKITETITKQIEQLQNTSIVSQYTGGDSVCVSFFDSTVYIVNAKQLPKYMRGNVILIHSEQITLSSNQNYRDIICIAPVITIEEGFSGTIQAFATDSIVINEDAILEYPSALCLIKKKLQPEQTPIIRIKQKAKVAANIYFEVPELYKNYARVHIEKDAEVFGTIYSQNYVSCYGSVFGTVYAKYVLSQTSRGMYKNTLIGGTFAPDKLPQQFANYGLIASKSKKVIIRKLY